MAPADRKRPTRSAPAAQTLGLVRGITDASAGRQQKRLFIKWPELCSARIDGDTCKCQVYMDIHQVSSQRYSSCNAWNRFWTSSDLQPEPVDSVNQLQGHLRGSAPTSSTSLSLLVVRVGELKSERAGAPMFQVLTPHKMQRAGCCRWLWAPACTTASTHSESDSMVRLLCARRCSRC